jgi:Zn-dependent protease
MQAILGGLGGSVLEAFLHVNIAEFVVMYLAFLFSTTCHEAAHALFALRGGDRTAYLGGHVTLDPTPHIRREPFGMVVVPIAGFLMSGGMLGWASVPVDPMWARQHPGRAALMSLAGPATNFTLAILALVVLKVLRDNGAFAGVAPNSAMGALRMLLVAMLELNILLGIFNLIPFPPLDGAGVAEGLAPRAMGSFYDRLRETPMLAFLGVIAIAMFVLRPLADPVIVLAYRLINA